MSQSRNDCDRADRPWSSSRVDLPRYSSAGRMSQKKATMQSCTTCLLRLPLVSWSRTRATGRALSMSNITGCARCCGSSPSLSFWRKLESKGWFMSDSGEIFLGSCPPRSVIPLPTAKRADSTLPARAGLPLWPVLRNRYGTWVHVATSERPA